jgi:hypothetical protein
MKHTIGGKNIGAPQVGIPVPTRPGGKTGAERAAVEELDVGESRVFTGYKSRFLTSTCSSIRKKYPERKYTVRSMGVEGLIVRVWRME